LIIVKAIKDVLQGKVPSLTDRRSPGWRHVRAVHLKANPSCEVCSCTDKLEVHHRKPFHLFPLLELEPSNLITLCESNKSGYNCHLFVGHMGNYRNYNKHVEKTVEFVRGWHEEQE